MFGLLFYFGLEIIGAVFNLIAMKFYDLTPEKMREVEAKIHQMRENADLMTNAKQQPSESGCMQKNL